MSKVKGISSFYHFCHPNQKIKLEIKKKMDPQSLSKKIATIIYVDQTAKSPFAKQLASLSESPMAYENDELLDLALTRIPLDQIYGAAEEKFKKDPTWGEHDYCIQELVV